MEKLPIKLDSTTAELIASRITKPDRLRMTRHLLRQRHQRLEKAARRPLKDMSDIRKFLVEFMTDSHIFFSYIYLSPRSPIPNNVDSIGAKRMQLFLEEAKRVVTEANQGDGPFKVPLQMLGHKLTHHCLNDIMYLYSIKSPDVLVLVTTIQGRPAPDNWADDWHLRFDFQGVTFRAFQGDAEHIIEAIAKNERLRRFNAYISWLFPILRGQAKEIARYREEERIDREALATLTSREDNLLGIYLAIFDRYGDADERILQETETIQTLWKTYAGEKSEWVIFTPSYYLPRWFVEFFDQLAVDDQRFLDGLDLNEWAEEEILRIISLLMNYRKDIQN